MSNIKTTISPPKGDPNESFEVTTSKGRVLACRTLGVIEEFRLNAILGSQDSINPSTSFHATCAAVVRSVDGVPYMFPETRQQLEAAILRLDRDGLKAVIPKLMELQEQDNSEEFLEQAGNSPATPA